MAEIETKRLTTTSGFSMVEILIVLTILAIAAAISVPGFQSYAKNANFRAAVREMEADIFKVKQMAISGSIDTYRITFDTSANTYSLSRTDTGTTLWTKTPSSFEQGIVMTNANFAGGVHYINFQRRGTLSSGNIKLANNSGRTAKITVNITGRTYVQIPSPD